MQVSWLVLRCLGVRVYAFLGGASKQRSRHNQYFGLGNLASSRLAVGRSCTPTNLRTSSVIVPSKSRTNRRREIIQQHVVVIRVQCITRCYNASISILASYNSRGGTRV